MTNAEVWAAIRLTRSAPPGLAESDERATIYRSALQQFEDLMRVAAVTGSAARPLPLFYAVSQAGMAIEACRAGSRSVGHGLVLASLQASMLQTPVSITGRGRFKTVSKCLGSPLPSKAPALGALIASLPELAAYVPDKSWPRPIELVPEEPPRPDYALWPVRSPLSATIYTDTPPDLATLEGIVSVYPDAAGKWRPNSHRDPQSGFFGYPSSDGRWWTTIGWTDKHHPREYREGAGMWLRPWVLADETPPTPLMTWWLVTFALSMLARYYPVEWIAALDVNRSPIAVLLEHTMTEAMEAVPEFVL